MIIAGPGLTCLCPPLFEYILFGSKEDCLEHEKPVTVDDIPLNAGTEVLINFIKLHAHAYFIA